MPAVSPAMSNQNTFSWPADGRNFLKTELSQHHTVRTHSGWTCLSCGVVNHACVFALVLQALPTFFLSHQTSKQSCHHESYSIISSIFHRYLKFTYKIKCQCKVNCLLFMYLQIYIKNIITTAWFLKMYLFVYIWSHGSSSSHSRTVLLKQEVLKVEISHIRNSPVALYLEHAANTLTGHLFSCSFMPLSNQQTKWQQPDFQ